MHIVVWCMHVCVFFNRNVCGGIPCTLMCNISSLPHSQYPSLTGSLHSCLVVCKSVNNQLFDGHGLCKLESPFPGVGNFREVSAARVADNVL